MKKVVCIIEARMSSTRFPGKVLKKIAGKKLLEILVSRLRLSKKISKLVIATSNKIIDQKIINFCKEKNISFYRGSEKNVLKRIHDTAKKNNADIIIRLTGDNPLVDPEMLDYMIEFFLENKFNYVCNNGLGIEKKREVPPGLDIQIFNYLDLKKVLNFVKKNEKKELVEHPPLYFYREGKKIFKIHNIKLPKKYHISKKLRLTVDTFQDFKNISKIINYFDKTKKKQFFNTKELKKYLI
jgi:spore coat polysaccharide biosynthesis protein SpsF